MDYNLVLTRLNIRQFKRLLNYLPFGEAHYFIFSDYPSESHLRILLKAIDPENTPELFEVILKEIKTGCGV